jgi:membrane-associated phospholipid phosphatase
MRRSAKILAVTLIAAAPAAHAQTAINLIALRGLAPFSTLLNTPAGKAALAANFTITGDIQTGKANQPALQPFPAQQAQALKDAAITSANGYEFADALGTKLGKAYQSLTSVTATTGTNISPNLANLIGYSFALTAADSAAAKTFFANETYVTKTSSAPVSPAAAAILTTAGGTTDVFGKAYHHPAGSKGADPLGDSRPFQTEPTVAYYNDPDFFGAPSSNRDYLYGPAQNLIKSPAFPSGHTTYGFTESLLFGIMVPERFPQMLTRGAEYGNSRIVLGAHYAMDVIAGRTLATYDLAHLLAENPAYLNRKFGKAPLIKSYGAALQAAKADLTAALTKACGASIAVCAQADTSRFSNPAANEVFYESTQTYGLPVVYPATANKVEDVAKIAPEAGDILTAAYPNLTLAQADAILTQTEGPGGGFLDNGSAFGLYSRLDYYKASIEAAAAK